MRFHLPRQEESHMTGEAFAYAAIASVPLSDIDPYLKRVKQLPEGLLASRVSVKDFKVRVEQGGCSALRVASTSLRPRVSALIEAKRTCSGHGARALLCQGFHVLPSPSSPNCNVPQAFAELANRSQTFRKAADFWLLRHDGLKKADFHRAVSRACGAALSDAQVDILFFLFQFDSTATQEVTPMAQDPIPKLRRVYSWPTETRHARREGRAVHPPPPPSDPTLP